MSDTQIEPPPHRGQSVPPHPFFASLAEDERTLMLGYFELVAVPTGHVVVREGDDDRAMYLVVEGHAKIVRQGLSVGELGPGAQLGELGLITQRSRAATVSATSDLELLRLTPERYLAMTNEQPRLALWLVHALVGDLADRLVEMTDNVGTLLRERSLPRRAQIDVHLGTSTLRVPTGTIAGALLPDSVGGHPVVAALVDRRAMSLATPLSSDVSLEPLSSAHWEGERIRRHSLALALVEAAYRHDPGLQLQMDHSVGFAQRVRVDGVPREQLPELAVALDCKLRELVAENVPLHDELWTLEEARAYFTAQGWTRASALLKTWRDPAVPLSSYGHAYAVALWPFVERTGRLQGFDIVPDEDGLLLVHGRDGGSRGSDPPPAIDGIFPRSFSTGIAARARIVSKQAAAMTEAQARWLSALGVHCVGSFNEACVRGDVSQIIRVSEGFQEKRISQIADRIASHAEALRVVSIAGPSSTGKTTFIRRLRVQLQVDGLIPVGLSLDDYYVDRDKTPRDEAGEYDFESLYALNLELLSEHVDRLLHGERVKTARYDFATGKSDPSGGPEIHLGPREVLMLEGIHGLNPELLATVPTSSLFRVFVCPLVQLPFDRVSRVSASDVRLLRRIVRDRHSRGATAVMNIKRWPAVRAGERRNIFPYQSHADEVFDTSLVYELSVLKVYAERYLLEVPSSDPAYATAFRLLSLLDRFVTIYPDHVPPTSILREFIGGLGFDRGG
jgi:uridine kinase